MQLTQLSCFQPWSQAHLAPAPLISLYSSSLFLQMPAALHPQQLIPVQLIYSGISHVVLNSFTFNKIPAFDITQHGLRLLEEVGDL